MNLARELVLAPVYALYGAWVLLRAGRRFARELAAVPWLLQSDIRCPTCSYANAVHDRWSCADCGAEFLGAVHTCGICGAGASWFPCERCRAAVALRGA